MKKLIFLVSCISLLIVSCNTDFNKSISQVEYSDLIFKDDVGYYGDKPYTGKVVVYHENGNKRYETNFVNGIDHGVFREWDDQGNLIEKSHMVSGKLEGKFIRFYPNGQKLFEGNYEKGEVQGKAFQWHENGQLKIEYHYDNGVEDGIYIFYNEQGKEILKGEILQGKRDGTWYEYNELLGKSVINIYENGEVIKSTIQSE